MTPGLLSPGAAVLGRARPYLRLRVPDEQQGRGARAAPAAVQAPQAEAVPAGAVQQVPGLLRQPGGQVGAQLGHRGLSKAAPEHLAQPRAASQEISMSTLPAKRLLKRPPVT